MGAMHAERSMDRTFLFRQSRIRMKTLLAAACLALASAAANAGETINIYKYRGADGRPLYSDRPIPGARLIESIQYVLPAPSSPRPDTSKSGAAGEERIKNRLSELDAAWAEVKASGSALAAAEARLAAGVTPEEGEPRALAGPPAPPPAGGPLAPAPPPAGGPMGTRRGGGFSPEYQARIAALEADVQAARVRNQEAWARFNQLR